MCVCGSLGIVVLSYLITHMAWGLHTHTSIQCTLQPAHYHKCKCEPDLAASALSARSSRCICYESRGARVRQTKQKSSAQGCEPLWRCAGTFCDERNNKIINYLDAMRARALFAFRWPDRRDRRAAAAVAAATNGKVMIIPYKYLCVACVRKSHTHRRVWCEHARARFMWDTCSSTCTHASVSLSINALRAVAANVGGRYYATAAGICFQQR